jgi:pilus assembly protein Flp/PilA
MVRLLLRPVADRLRRHCSRSFEMSFIRKFIKNEKGATAIEYGLIAALIAVAMITAVRSVGSKVGDTFNVTAGNMNG